METATAIIIGSIIMGACSIISSLLYARLLWQVEDQRQKRIEAQALKTAE